MVTKSWMSKRMFKLCRRPGPRKRQKKNKIKKKPKIRKKEQFFIQGRQTLAQLATTSDLRAGFTSAKLQLVNVAPPRSYPSRVLVAPKHHYNIFIKNDKLN